MANKNRVCLVTNQTDFTTIKKLETNLEKDWSLEITKTAVINSFEVSTLIKGIVLVYVNANQDVKEIVEYIKRIDVEKVRVIVLSSSMNEKIESTLMNAGCATVYSNTVSWGILKQTIDEQVAIINNELKTYIKEIEPISLEADCWYLERSEHIKKINGVWYLYLIGPGPNVGRWEASQDLGREAYYEFIPAEPLHPTMRGEVGRWFFKGKKPIFSQSLWHFIGPDPELFYFLNDVTEIYKFKTENKKTTLAISKNSEICKRKLPDLEDSHYTYYKYEKTAEKFEPLKGDITSDFSNRINSRLSGRIQKSAPKKVVDLGKESKHFNLVESILEKKKYLNLLAAKDNNLIIWTKGQKTVLEGSAQKVKDGQYEITFDNKKAGEDLIYNLQNGIESSAYVRGNLDEASVFFTLDGPTFSVNTIQLLVPNMMWKVQRRKFSRVMLDGRKKTRATIKVLTNNRVQTITAPIKNIGAGGMSILVEDSYFYLFEKGQKINEVKFILDEEPFYVMADVKWKGEVAARDQLAGHTKIIGLEFQYLTNKELDFIQRFVLENLHDKELASNM